jgi:hypothetical protein
MLLMELGALTEGETDWIANFSNAAALLYQRLPELNWAGFYLLKTNEAGPAYPGETNPHADPALPQPVGSPSWFWGHSRENLPASAFRLEKGFAERRQ